MNEEHDAMLTITPREEPRAELPALTGSGSWAFILLDASLVTRKDPITLMLRKRPNSATEASAISAILWAPICNSPASQSASQSVSEPWN